MRRPRPRESQPRAQGRAACWGVGLCNPLRVVWGRGSGPAGGAPYPTANTDWAPTDCWGRASGGGPASETDRRGDGAAQAACKGQGAPGGAPELFQEYTGPW